MAPFVPLVEDRDDVHGLGVTISRVARLSGVVCRKGNLRVRETEEVGALILSLLSR